MSKNNFPRVILRENEENEILQGFCWVFDNEISHIKYRANEKSEWKNENLKQCQVENGSVVEIYTKAGGFLATGILNKNSKITIRIISRENADRFVNNIEEFWKNRVQNAVSLRSLCFNENDSYRLIFAEADLIPGFICERFCTIQGEIVLVVQFLSLSCEIYKKQILDALNKICKPNGIFERSDASVREKEGLPLASGWIGKKLDSKIMIEENGVKLLLDIENGQKTGYFLDQKFNRQILTRFCNGKTVLDTFTHTGAFGLNAALSGAKKVISVDISEDAINLVNQNIRLNNVQNQMTAVCSDVFDLLKMYEKNNQKFDVIILDPPAFAKSAKMVEKAYGGYKEINLRAMRLLNPNGILITCSCSHFMGSQMFCDMIMHAAKDSHKTVQILEKRGAGPDHPVLLGYPKSEYLKCVVCRVQ